MELDQVGVNPATHCVYVAGLDISIVSHPGALPLLNNSY